jgi:predicted Zn-dependent protease
MRRLRCVAPPEDQSYRTPLLYLAKEKILKKLTIILCLAFAGSSVLAGGVAGKPIATLSAAFTQGGETYSHKEAGVQFELPKGWKAKADGETVTVSTPDDSLQMVFWVPDEDTFEAAVKALDKELDKTIKNLKTTGKPKEDTHNGMPHYGESGTGEVSGVTIEWSVDVLAAKKVVIVLSFAAPGVWEKHADDAAKFIGSIKKIE